MFHIIPYCSLYFSKNAAENGNIHSNEATQISKSSTLIIARKSCEFHSTLKMIPILLIMFDLIKRSKMKGTRDESALEFEMQFLALISSLAVRKVCMSALGITYAVIYVYMYVYH